MGIFGSAIGGALGVGGSIFGGISASKAMKKVKENLQDQKKENQAWYNRRYNEDATQRADAQRVLTETMEAIRQRNQQSAANQAVMGGTEESVAASKAANSDAMANAASQIAVAADTRKDQIEQQYQATNKELNKELNNMEIQKANALAQAVQGVAQAGGSIASAFDPVPTPTTENK